MAVSTAKFSIGDVVKHRHFDFRGVIYDVDFRHFCREGKHRIAVNEVSDPQRFGIVELDGDRITEVHEKPENPPTPSPADAEPLRPACPNLSYCDLLSGSDST